ncbi:MAG: hypothetical protein GY928_21340 [Colwellia sp.]|nr:hypothetical protein [Colwellia sp.]
MSKIKLVSQSSAYDELFTTATYTEGVGIYPAYENALRSVYGTSNIINADYQNGKFTVHVPTGQTFGQFVISSSILQDGKDYGLYFTSSIALDSLQIANGSFAYWRYNNSSPTVSENFTININDNTNSIFRLTPFATDYDTDIEIEYTIVPKGYPKLQTWGGSQLTTSIDSGVKSISFSLSDWYDRGENWQQALNVNSTSNTLASITSSGTSLGDNVYYIRVYTSSGYNQVSVTNIASDVITFSKTGDIINIYRNKSLVGSYDTYASQDYSNIKTNLIGTSISSFNISQLVTSTEESTGYPQGTIIAIQPTCKLGILGSEIDLPTKSRTISTMRRDVKKIELESVNATPTTQYIATKRKLDINYEIINESDKASILAIEDSQYTQKSRLNYIYNSESGQLHNMTVRMTTASAGNRIQRDKYFEAAIGMELKEC